MTMKEKLKNIYKIITYKEKRGIVIKTAKVVCCSKCMCPLFEGEIMCPDCLTPRPEGR